MAIGDLKDLGFSDIPMAYEVSDAVPDSVLSAPAWKVGGCSAAAGATLDTAVVRVSIV